MGSGATVSLLVSLRVSTVGQVAAVKVHFMYAGKDRNGRI